MKEKYLASVKKLLLSPNNKKALFFILLNHFEIKKLKSLPDFNSLKNFVISSKDITSQEVFGAVAIKAVQRKKLHTLKFLINECGYRDLTKTADPNKITLLHEACLYGANDIVEYLLQKGSDPNAQDWQRETPLHRAAQQESNTSIITILCNHKANLNIKNVSGLTPLFTAILYKNSAASLEFIKQQKGRKKIACNIEGRELNHLEFKQEVEKGNIENASPIDLLSPEVSLNQQAVVTYYYACLLPNFNQQLFQNVKAWLRKIPGPLSKKESHYLIDTFILTSKVPFNPQSLIDELLKLIRSGKLITEFAVSGLLSAAKNFAEQNEIEIVTTLNNFVFYKLINNEISAEKVANFYHVLGTLYKQIGLFPEGEYCLQQAIQNLSEERADKDKAEIFFNLACTQAFLMRRKDALENFKKAFYFDQTDEESFQHYLTYLLEFRYYDEALKVCSESNFNEYSEICTAYVHTLMNESSWSDLLKIVDTKFSSHRANIMALDLKANCYIELNNSEQAIITINENLAITEEIFKDDKTVNIASGMFKALHVYMQAGAYKLGLELAERFEKEYPLEFGYSVLCKTVGIAFYLVNQNFDKAEFLIQKVRSSGANIEMLAEVYLLTALEALSQKGPNTYSIAMQYIDSALEINSNHFKAQFYKLLIAILQNDQATAKDILQNIESELEVDTSLIKELLQKIENPEETDNFILEEQISLELKKYDPIKIHQFFQAEKTHLLNEITAILPKNPKPKTQWKVGRICFEEGTEELIRIQHPRFPECYAVIHPDLHLDKTLFAQFQNALNNSNNDQIDLGESKIKAPRKLNNNVQTLNNSIVQLKIDQNNRLWTDTVYHADNKYLIVFDHAGYHAEVKKKARKGKKIKVIDLSKQQPSILNPGNISGVFAAPPAEIIPEDKPVNITITNPAHT